MIPERIIFVSRGITVRVGEMCRSCAALARSVLMAEFYRLTTEARRIELLQTKSI